MKKVKRRRKKEARNPDQTETTILTKIKYKNKKLQNMTKAMKNLRKNHLLRHLETEGYPQEEKVVPRILGRRN